MRSKALGESLSRTARSWKTRAGIAVVALFIAFYLFMDQQKTKPEYAMRTFHSCLEDQDAGCLYDLMSPQERAVGPTQDQFEAFMKEVFGPRMKYFKPISEVNVEPGTEAGILVFGERAYKNASGQTVTFGAAGYRTERHAVVYPLFSMILLGLFQLDRRVDEKSSYVMERGILTLRPELERIGIKGAYLRSGDAERFYNWDQWIDYIKRQRKRSEELRLSEHQQN